MSLISLKSHPPSLQLQQPHPKSPAPALCSCERSADLLLFFSLLRWENTKNRKNKNLLLLTSLGISSSWDVWELESIPDERKYRRQINTIDISCILIFIQLLLVSEATQFGSYLLEKPFEQGTARYNKAVNFHFNGLMFNTTLILFHLRILWLCWTYHFT